MYRDSAMHYSGTCFQENDVENYCMCETNRALNSMLRWDAEMRGICVTLEVRVGYCKS